MKEIRMYRLFDGGDEVEKSGWHFSKAAAERAMRLCDTGSEPEMEVREVPVTVDTLRNAVFLYKFNCDYVSRTNLVILTGEERVKYLEDLKNSPVHDEDRYLHNADTMWDYENVGGDVFGVGCMNISMTGENETKGRLLSVHLNLVTYDGNTTRVFYDVPYYADFDKEAFKGVDSSINNLCRLIEKECNKFDFWGEIEKSMEDFNNKNI